MLLVEEGRHDVDGTFLTWHHKSSVNPETARTQGIRFNFAIELSKYPRYLGYLFYILDACTHSLFSKIRAVAAQEGERERVCVCVCVWVYAMSNSTQSSSWPLEASSQASDISSAPQPLNSVNRIGAVISKIEDIFESMFDALQTGNKELSIPLRSRRASQRSQPQSQSDNQDADASTSPANASRRTSRAVVTFPGKTAQEAEKFSMVTPLWTLALSPGLT